MSGHTAVTVIGLGPMGQAMAHSLLRAGHTVTVWNRTPNRADGVVQAGALLAETPAAALAASELVVLSLTDYAAMYDIIGEETAALAGRLLVNLSSDSPDRTRDAAAWAAEHRARFLAGGVMVPAQMVGSAAAYVFYSGPRAGFDTAEPALRVLGQPRYLGDDPALAQLYYQADLTIFLTTLAALLQAIALVGSAGVPASGFVAEAMSVIAGIPAMLAAGEPLAEQVDTDTHPGTLSTTRMMGATADHIVTACRAASLDSALPEAVQSLYTRAIDAGDGDLNWTSLMRVIRPDSPTTA